MNGGEDYMKNNKSNEDIKIYDRVTLFIPTAEKTNWHLLTIVAVSLCILTLIAFFIIIHPLEKITAEVGAETGKDLGVVAGKAVGSVKGFYDGWDAYKDEVETALSAKDTVASITNNLKYKVGDRGILDVLIIDASIPIEHSVGNTYKALLLPNGHATFKVDLNKAIIVSSEDRITITLPSPYVTATIDRANIPRIDEWQRTVFNGSSKNGATALINSLNQAEVSFETEISNDVDLFRIACDSASKTVRDFALAARGSSSLDIEVTCLEPEKR